MLVIILFILLLNIVSIVLMYYCLGDLGKKEKLIYIAAGVAVMYGLTSFVYWISTKGIEMTQVSETGKDLITFLFVPINGIVVLPILAKSYYKYKIGSLKGNVLRNRGIVLGLLLIILLIIECSYFKNIQEQVVNLIEQNRNNYYEEQTVTIQNSITNEITDAIDVQNENSIEGEKIENIVSTGNGNVVDIESGNTVQEVRNETNYEETTVNGLTTYDNKTLSSEQVN